MYIATKTQLRLTETDDGWVATSSFVDSDGHIQLENFDLNESAAKVIEHLTINNDTTSFVDDFCRRHDIDREESIGWISEFIDGLRAYGVAVVTQERSEFKAEITRLGGSRVPNSVTIEVTNTCNEACDHCYVSAGPNRHERITLSRFKSLCDELSSSGVLMVELTGGEVFMHPNFTEMLDYACRRFAKVALLTNATILTNRALETIKTHKDKLYISISLDSVNAEKHNLFRHHRKGFEKTCANIERLTEAGLFVRVTSCIWEGNKWELEELCSLARELGAKAFSFNFVDDFGRGVEFSKENRHKETEEFNRMVARVMSENSDLIPTVMNNDVKNAHNCGASKNSITVSPQGKLRPCNLFPQDFVIGDVLEDGLWMSAVTSDDVKRVQKIPSPSVEHGCNPKCPNRSYCTGCYLKGLNSNAGKPDAEMCSWVRTNKLQPFVHQLASAAD